MYRSFRKLIKMDKNKIFLVLVALLTSTGIYKVTSQSNPVFDGALDQLHPAIIYQEFTNYMLKYNKVYTPSERSYRLDIFAHSYWFVMSQNAKKSTWKAALNKYSDMTQEEIKIKVLIEYPEEPKAPSKKLVEKIYNTDPPAEKNWVTDGAVTSVKDEGSCGSGYAFGAVEPYESAHYLMYKELVSFSAQQIVDCSKAYGNKGCNVRNAF
jgi:C1A family cysteine protease